MRQEVETSLGLAGSWGRPTSMPHIRVIQVSSETHWCTMCSQRRPCSGLRPEADNCLFAELRPDAQRLEPLGSIGLGQKIERHVLFQPVPICR